MAVLAEKAMRLDASNPQGLDDFLGVLDEGWRSVSELSITSAKAISASDRIVRKLVTFFNSRNESHDEPENDGSTGATDYDRTFTELERRRVKRAIYLNDMASSFFWRSGLSRREWFHPPFR